MKLTNAQLYEATETMHKLYNEAKLPIKAAAIVNTDIKSMELFLKSFSEERTKIIQKYADVSKSTEESAYISPEKREDFNKDMNTLLGVDFDVNIKQLSIDDLSIEITPAELDSISFIFKELNETDSEKGED